MCKIAETNGLRDDRVQNLANKGVIGKIAQTLDLAFPLSTQRCFARGSVFGSGAVLPKCSESGCHLSSLRRYPPLENVTRWHKQRGYRAMACKIAQTKEL